MSRPELYLRIERAGKWQPIEVAVLTDIELEGFTSKLGEVLARSWVERLVQVLRAVDAGERRAGEELVVRANNIIQIARTLPPSQEVLAAQLARAGREVKAIARDGSLRVAGSLDDDIDCVGCQRPVCRREGCGVYSEVGQALCVRCYAFGRPTP